MCESDDDDDTGVEAHAHGNGGTLGCQRRRGEGAWACDVNLKIEARVPGVLAAWHSKGVSVGCIMTNADGQVSGPGLARFCTIRLERALRPRWNALER